MTLTSGQNGRIDPSVVASLYADHAEELRAFLIGVLRDAELAGEVAQAAFARVMEAGHTAKQETMKGWLFRVAYNEAMLIRRRQKVHDKSLRALAWTPPALPATAEQTASQRETIAQVRAAMEQLPPEQQRVVRMRIDDEKTFAVIAAELGVPLGTVLTRMRLALNKLSDQFSAD